MLTDPKSYWHDNVTASSLFAITASGTNIFKPCSPITEREKYGRHVSEIQIIWRTMQCNAKNMKTLRLDNYAMQSICT